MTSWSEHTQVLLGAGHWDDMVQRAWLSVGLLGLVAASELSLKSSARRGFPESLSNVVLCVHVYSSIFNLKFHYSKNLVLLSKQGEPEGSQALCLPEKSMVPASAGVCPPRPTHPDVYSSRNHSTSSTPRQCGQVIPADPLLCLLGGKPQKTNYQSPRQGEPITPGRASALRLVKRKCQRP